MGRAQEAGHGRGEELQTCSITNAAGSGSGGAPPVGVCVTLTWEWWITEDCWEVWKDCGIVPSKYNIWEIDALTSIIYSYS
jgi:hypothetical protein